MIKTVGQLIEELNKFEWDAPVRLAGARTTQAVAAITQAESEDGLYTLIL